MHKSITVERVTDGVSRSMFGTDNVGFCLKCGEENNGCEPDMEGGKCEACGESAVTGAENCLLRIA